MVKMEVDEAEMTEGTLEAITDLAVTMAVVVATMA
jgi:hypothetical protein